ncbi:MAG: hypothetical protein KGL67_01740, partial [Patescibacteria group bacterium]|nr:hypothetical protein [Patescibacteria group bacterium]
GNNNINGSSNTTFATFSSTVTFSQSKIIYFKAGNTYTFATALNLSGTAHHPIHLDSDTEAQQWFMNLGGSNSIVYVKVEDGGCNGGGNVTANNYTIYDYGNNGSCWSLISINKFHGGGGVEASAAAPDVQHGGGGGGGVGGGAGGGGGAEGSGGRTTAAGTAVLSTNTVGSVSIISGGSGYGTTPPSVSFCGGGGTGAAGTAVLTAGAVSGVTMTNNGTNYTSAPTVVFGGTCGGTGGGAGGGDSGFLYHFNNLAYAGETSNEAWYLFKFIFGFSWLL